MYWTTTCELESDQYSKRISFVSKSFFTYDVPKPPCANDILIYTSLNKNFNKHLFKKLWQHGSGMFYLIKRKEAEPWGRCLFCSVYMSVYCLDQSYWPYQQPRNTFLKETMLQCKTSAIHFRFMHLNLWWRPCTCHPHPFPHFHNKYSGLNFMLHCYFKSNRTIW